MYSPPERLLLGPGPSNAAPTVLQAMNSKLIGHLDPEFIKMMEEIKSMLRLIFKTENEMTFPVSGTGSAGMETCFVNLIEPGDEVVIGVNGVFGMRMCDVAERCGANVIKVEAEWGNIIEPSAIKSALKKCRPKIVAIVHAETSTGALTPVEEISRITHEAEALLLLDTVTSLGGCPVSIDEWQVDAVYSGTQKCLSCPPGLAPVSFSPNAMEVISKRNSKVQSWYLDINFLANYWGSERIYHHTAPISMNYAIHEALQLVLAEGLEIRWNRHQKAHETLKRGLAKFGLSITSQEGHQLWQLNAVSVPSDINEEKIRNQLLNEFGIEVGPGLGPLKGEIWRVGLMGYNATDENVEHFLEALSKCLP